MEAENKSYFKENLPTLIEKLKNSIEVLYPIIEQEIDGEIKDDKLLNVLKAKRQAAEDVEWTLKKIDELENLVNGVEEEKIADQPLKKRVRTPRTT